MLRTFLSRTWYPPGALLVALLGVVLLCAQAGYGELPFEIPSRESLSRFRSAVIYTNRGPLYLELYPEDAPVHVTNLKYLADRGAYRGVRFSKLRPGYALQIASSRKYTYRVPPEFNDHQHTRGAIGMARVPDAINPGRESDPFRFHLILGDATRLDGAYTIFGRVVDGFEVLDALRAGDLIEDLRVYVRDHTTRH